MSGDHNQYQKPTGKDSLQVETMKQALDELEYVLECINQDRVPFDGDDYHETMRLLRQAIEQAEKQKPVAWDGECVLGHCGSPSGCDDSGCCRANATSPKTGTWAVYIKDDYVWFEIADSISAQHFRIDNSPFTEDDFVITHSPEWMKRQLESALRKLTAPPQREWVGLTDEEIEGCDPSDECWNLEAVARAIEAKLKEKNT